MKQDLIKKTSDCEWHQDYYQLVTCDDVTEIIVETTDDDVEIQNDGTFAYVVSGANTFVNPFELIDVGADFVTSLVTTEMYVRNTDTDVSTKVVNVVAASTLTLLDDIFTATPENYVITYYDTDGLMSIGTNTMEKGVTGVGYFRQEVLTAGLFYKVEIDVTSFGRTTAGDSIRFKIGGETILVENGLITEATGTKTFYGVADGADPLAVEIYCDATVLATFANFKIFTTSNVVFFIMDCETDEIVYGSSLTDVVPSTQSNQIKLLVDWSVLLNGYDCENACYYIGGVSDVGIPINLTEDRINNGNFDSATDWTLEPGWSISGGKATILAGGTRRILEQSNLAYNFSKGLSYTFSIQVVDYVIGFASLKLYNGATEIFDAGTFILQPSGYYTVTTGVLSANCDIIKINSSANANFAIDSIAAVLDLDFSVSGLRTDCFQLAESHDCTVKLSGTNLDNAFGIDFIGLSYSPFVRVQGQLRTPTYEDDSEVEEDSLGANKMIYFNSDKIYILHLYDLPEYLHDFIRLLKGYDTFLIDNSQYFPTDKGYKPEWITESNKVYDKANVNITVKQKTELNKNKYC